jgi:hypothetical protein
MAEPPGFLCVRADDLDARRNRAGAPTTHNSAPTKPFPLADANILKRTALTHGSNDAGHLAARV